MSFVITTSIILLQQFGIRDYLRHSARNITTSTLPDFLFIPNPIEDTVVRRTLHANESEHWACLWTTSTHAVDLKCGDLFAQALSKHSTQAVLLSKTDNRLVLISSDNRELRWCITLDFQTKNVLISNVASKRAIKAGDVAKTSVCFDYVFRKKVITIDLDIFESSQFVRSHFTAHASESHLSMPPLCSDVARTVERQDPAQPFTVISGVGPHTQAFAYWLDRCGIELLTAHIWDRGWTAVSGPSTHKPLAPSSQSRDARSHYADMSEADATSVWDHDSICTVQKITGYDSVLHDRVHRNNGKTCGDNGDCAGESPNPSVICLEDVIRLSAPDSAPVTYLAAPMLCDPTPSATAAEARESQSGTQVCAGASDRHTSELQAVLRAFANCAHVELAVRSLVSPPVPSLHHPRPEDPREGHAAAGIRSLVLEASLAVDSAPWTVLLKAIEDETSRSAASVANSRESTIRLFDFLSALLSAMSDFLVTPVELLCRQQILQIDSADYVAPFADPSTAGYCDTCLPASLFCRSSALREKLANTLSELSSCPCYSDQSSGNHCMTLLGVLNRLIAVLRRSSSVGDHSSAEQRMKDRQADFPSSAPAASHSATTVSIDLFSFAYVLILLPSPPVSIFGDAGSASGADDAAAHSELWQVLRLVEEWKDNVTCPTCPLYSKYVILRTPTCPRGPSYAACTFRLALIHVSEWIDSLAVNNDLVIVLQGLEGVRAFVRPGSPTSIIPHCEYAKMEYFRLSSLIVVASSSEGEKSRVDLRAFEGTAPALRGMLQALRRNPLYAMSNWGAEYAFREYMSEHPDVVGTDTARAHFDFTSVLVGSDAVEAGLGAHVDQAADRTGGESGAAPATQPSSVPAKLRLTTLPTVVLVGSRLVGANGLADWNAVQRVSTEVGAALNEHHWLESSHMILDLHRQLFNTNLAILPVHFTFSFGIFGKHTNHVSLADKEAIAHRLLERRSVLAQLQSNEQTRGVGTVLEMRLSLGLQGLSLAAAAFLLETGPFDEAAACLRSILHAPWYAEVEGSRRTWATQRRLLRRTVQGAVRVHFVTAASEDTAELGHLRRSAALSGIELTVLGLNRSYTGYHDKLNWYHEYVASSNSVVGDDDVVVLMDAYDVLLFPAANDFGEKFQTTAPTPIVFCAESGIYPDFSAAWFYPRGRAEDSFHGGLGVPRFLNSGCIIGRGGQMKDMLAEAQVAGEYYRDDQRWFVLYAIMHPHLVSLDVDNRFFLTTHAFRGEVFLSPDLRLTLKSARTPRDIGLVHCNNRASNAFYDRFVDYYLRTRDTA